VELKGLLARATADDLAEDVGEQGLVSFQRAHARSVTRDPAATDPTRGSAALGLEEERRSAGSSVRGLAPRTTIFPPPAPGSKRSFRF
jgi:hypothetical protein